MIIQLNKRNRYILLLMMCPSGKVTNDILDILKSEEVPATFFVIGNQIDNQEDIILRMRDEGHSIGLHSYTHERNNLYSNNDGFYK